MDCQSNNRWRFCKILWPSQNIRTLPKHFHFSSFEFLLFLNFSCHNFVKFLEFFKNSSQNFNQKSKILSSYFLWQQNYSVDFAYLQHIPSPYGTYLGYKKGCLLLSNRKTHLGAAQRYTYRVLQTYYYVSGQSQPFWAALKLL